MPQNVIGRQEGFSWDRSPVPRPWLQAHVDPLTGSPAVKLLIVKDLEGNSSLRRRRRTLGAPMEAPPDMGAANWAPEAEPLICCSQGPAGSGSVKPWIPAQLSPREVQAEVYLGTQSGMWVLFPSAQDRPAQA